MLKNKQPEKKRSPIFMISSSSVLSFTGDDFLLLGVTCSGDLCLSAAVQWFLCRRLHGLLGGGLILQIASWTVHPKILRKGTSGRNSELQHVGK